MFKGKDLSYVMLSVFILFAMVGCGNEQKKEVEIDYPAVVADGVNSSKYNVQDYMDCETISYGNKRYVNYLSIEERIYTNYYFDKKDAYVDIVSIEPKYRVQEYENDVPSIDTDIVCECYTQEGYKVYIYISPYAYTSYIDENADFSTLLTINSYEKKEFEEPLRLYGQARMAEDMCEDLSKETKTDLIFEFTRMIDSEDVE